jgi:hypothetical protein
VGPNAMPELLKVSESASRLFSAISDLKSIYHNEHVTEVQGWQGTKATSMK